MNKDPSAPPNYEHVPAFEVVSQAHGFVVVHDSKIDIPTHFLNVWCCAFSCSNTTWPGCCGFRASGTFLCFEGYMSRWKFSDSPDVCFLCYSGDVECVQPRTCCKVYEQFFCFECFCSLPLSSEGFRAAPVGTVGVVGSALIDSAIIYRANCCCIESCNCAFPNCLLDGCYTKTECCCLKSEEITYRWMCWDKERPNPDTCCVLMKSQSVMKKPTTCCKGMIHQPGCDYRCALPCDDDVPCTFSLFPFCIGCVNCRPYCVSCITVEQLKNQARSQASPRTVVHVAQHSFVH